MREPTVIPTKTAAALLGISPRTLHDWMATDQSIRACVVRATRRRCWWSVPRLRERGLLERQSNVAAPSVSIGFSYVTSGIEKNPACA
jgi:hypothetical protein